VLELDSGHSEEEKSIAAKTLHEQAKIDLIGKIIRSKGDLRNKSKPTPSHFASATYRHKSSMMTEVIDKNNNLHTTQSEIENAHVDMWKDVFRNRNTSSEARDKVFSALDRTLPSEAKKKLGELSDNSPQTFCTIQDVVDSISSVKMNKSPGIDGLPGDFYLALLPFHDSLIARLLHATFIESYKSGILPTSMRKSCIRLLYKKDSEVDKRYPQNYRPIALLSCDYKILSRFLSSTLNPLLHHILDPTQFCQAGKDIGELIITLDSVIDHLKKNISKANSF